MYSVLEFVSTDNVKITAKTMSCRMSFVLVTGSMARSDKPSVALPHNHASEAGRNLNVRFEGTRWIGSNGTVSLSIIFVEP